MAKTIKNIIMYNINMFILKVTETYDTLEKT